MSSDHEKDCIPGQSLGGQTYRLGLLTDDLVRTVVSEARQSLPGRMAVWLVDHLPGHRLREIPR